MIIQEIIATAQYLWNLACIARQEGITAAWEVEKKAFNVSKDYKRQILERRIFFSGMCETAEKGVYNSAFWDQTQDFKKAHKRASRDCDERIAGYVLELSEEVRELKQKRLDDIVMLVRNRRYSFAF